MNPLVLPLNIGKDDSFRVSWNNRFFVAKGAIVLPKRILNDNDAQEVLKESQFVLKLTEFKSSLRSKLLSSLANKNPAESATDSEVFGFVMKINITEGRVECIEDARKTITRGSTESVNFLGDSAEPLTLNDDERNSLLGAVNKALTAQILEAVRQPFVPFASALSESWKERDLKSIQADKLVPYQMLFPNSQPIERFVDGERYVIDDLYCTNPACSCTDVTCVVLKFLPSSGTEVAWGGFKWNIESDKFRPLPQFTHKFNASEWFKQFSTTSAFDLKLLLSRRQAFMRTEYIAARRAVRS